MLETATHLAPVHPGEILLEEFLKPYGLSPYRAAQRLHVPRTRIERLVAGEMGVTADTALRLGRLFGTTPAFWANLQSRYDLQTAVTPPELDEIEPLILAPEPKSVERAAEPHRPPEKAVTPPKVTKAVQPQEKRVSVDVQLGPAPVVPGSRLKKR